jgi:GMP synthase (glutamine-hydrolysing)
MRVGVIYHCDQTTNRLDEVLDSRGAEVVRYRLDQGSAVPATTAFDAVIVLGGAMGAYDTVDHPWLEDEKAWLQRLTASGIPVLGICLGCQLLADGLGGRAFLSPQAPEAGVVKLELTAAGRADPVVRHAGTKVLSLHQDTFELPSGATLLAVSADYPQAFRYESVLAIQFHPDADAALGVEWAKEMAPFLNRAGVELVDYQRDLEDAEPYLAQTSRRIFQAFLEDV